MTRPRRYLVRMALFLAAVTIVVALLAKGLLHAFLVNPALNGLILGVMAAGVLLNVRSVLSLVPEVRWLEALRAKTPTPALSTDRPPRLLAPMAAMLGERQGRFSLSAATLRSLLDGISGRLDESREIARYFTGLLIFLGLLGTFWGLSRTVGSIGDVIRNLTISGDDIDGAFTMLKQGLEAPLSGMGTAFSTSLFGLSGSLVLGFLELTAGQAQTAFLHDLEEWLSGQVKLGGGGGSLGEAGEQSVPAYLQALLEQTAESLDNLQRVILRGEENRQSANSNLRLLTDKLSTLGDQMRAEQTLMIRLAEGQLELKPILAKLSESSGGGGMDEMTRTHIRNVDVAVGRMLDDIVLGRDEMIREIRSEFKLLARTIAAVAEDAQR